MKKVNTNTWTKLYVTAGILDIVQFFIDFTGIGFGINAYIDPIIGVGFIAYLNHIGVKMFQHPSRLLSMIGAGILEEFTGGIAPAWIMDIYYIHYSYRKEFAKYEEQEKISELTANTRATVYNDGRRMPNSSENTQNKPLVENGYRRPTP